jgi:hypothetical protein
VIDIVFHYPPELFNLLVDTIPLLCKGKKDLLLFFYGAGVPRSIAADLQQRVDRDAKSVKKQQIVRTILERLNQRGEGGLAERREVLRRVVEFDSFSTCWPEDQLKAKGLVAEVRSVVDVKDSFTRMRLEREEERRGRLEGQQAKIRALERGRQEFDSIRRDFFSLFGEQNAQKRGKALEKVLNHLFRAAGIGVREAFALVGTEGEGAVEQVDGVVEIDADLYLVEMKWLKDPVGVPEVSAHLVRVFNRGYMRGILISASEYTQPAVTICRESLQRTVVVLCRLQEIVHLLEQEWDLKAFLKTKIRAAMISKNPLHTVTELQGAKKP